MLCAQLSGGLSAARLVYALRKFADLNYSQRFCRTEKLTDSNVMKEFANIAYFWDVFGRAAQVPRLGANW
jgi:hypothetical protein